MNSQNTTMTQMTTQMTTQGAHTSTHKATLRAPWSWSSSLGLAFRTVRVKIVYLSTTRG